MLNFPLIIDVSFNVDLWGGQGDLELKAWVVKGASWVSFRLRLPTRSSLAQGVHFHRLHTPCDSLQPHTHSHTHTHASERSVPTRTLGACSPPISPTAALLPVVVPVVEGSTRPPHAGQGEASAGRSPGSDGGDGREATDSARRAAHLGGPGSRTSPAGGFSSGSPGLTVSSRRLCAVFASLQVTHVERLVPSALALVGLVLQGSGLGWCLGPVCQPGCSVRPR